MVFHPSPYTHFPGLPSPFQHSTTLYSLPFFELVNGTLSLVRIRPKVVIFVVDSLKPLFFCNLVRISEASSF